MKKILQLCVLIFGCATSASATDTPPAILVNGITTILGDVRVLFKAGDDAGNDFMLAIGEERAGIRLLDVQVQKGVVQFDNHGVLQKISICPTPELVSVPEKSAAGKFFGGRSPSTLSTTADAAASPAQKNSEVPSGNFALGGGAAGKKTDSASGSTDDKGAATDGTADQKNEAGKNSDNSNSWWYRAAEEMEAARLATAESVRNGEHPAYPLTPLTPPGMDARLIGDGQLYFNHFQRFIGPGLVAQ